MEKNIGCIIARTNSTRLPKKVLIEIDGKLVIEHIIDRVKRVKNLDKIYLCTSRDPNDKILLEIAQKEDILGYAGSRDKVIDRMIEVGKIENATNLIRITGDNIFTDEILLNRLLEEHMRCNSDYSRVSNLPMGVTAEIFSVKGLKNIYNSIDPTQSEYLTYFVFFTKNDLNKLIIFPPKKFNKPLSSLTLDTPQDLARIKFIFNKIKTRPIYLDKIFDLHQKIGIPYFIVDKEVKIKLPNNIKMLYKRYLKKIAQQYNECKNIEIKEDFYDKRKYHE